MLYMPNELPPVPRPEDHVEIETAGVLIDHHDVTVPHLSTGQTDDHLGYQESASAVDSTTRPETPSRKHIGWDDELPEIDFDAPLRPYVEPERPLKTERTATSVLDPNVQRRFTVYERTEIEMGVEVKDILHARDEYGNELTYLERSAKADVIERRESNENYIKAWRRCHEAGIRVPSEVLVSDEDTLFVTDVKADGSEVYGKGMARALGSYNPDQERHRPHPEIDAHFMHLTAPENIHAIEAEARRVSALAIQANMELACDDPFELVIHPDGSWELMSLDLNETICYEPEEVYGVIAVRLGRNNREAPGFFMEQIAKIRHSLSNVAG